MMNYCINKCKKSNLCRCNCYRNHCVYPMYLFKPVMISPYISLINVPPVNAPSSGTLNTLCHSQENVIYDSAFPNRPMTVSITNRSTDCVSICYIYYTDGFYVKRLSGQAQPGQTYTFNEVKTPVKVSIQCNPLDRNCTSCGNGTNEIRCIVDYVLA